MLQTFKKKNICNSGRRLIFDISLPNLFKENYFNKISLIVLKEVKYH